ncbi:Pyridoxamine 5'-phosphate oxidase family protein [Penicillium digitatum]|uniref:Pyridoxamine 5'-phosphate oxidase family protein n=1 Tax=Penicillium digitatum TaxID=36651 RepID=A0A7T6XVL4_PENDI|nr:Pyridoxamine 5'-phosphate oxidase family protein [Penicillium digitatum]
MTDLGGFIIQLIHLIFIYIGQQLNVPRMPTIFPTWPHILFGVLEPISLALGSVFPVYDLRGFIAGQTPTIVAPATLHPSSIALAYQLGNLYSLLFLVGVGVCHATTEPRVLHNYLIGLAIADTLQDGML